jgi:hypothetical protein
MQYSTTAFIPPHQLFIFVLSLSNEARLPHFGSEVHTSAVSYLKDCFYHMLLCEALEPQQYLHMCDGGGILDIFYIWIFLTLLYFICSNLAIELISIRNKKIWLSYIFYLIVTLYSLLAYSSVTILDMIFFLFHWSVYFRREPFVFISIAWVNSLLIKLSWRKPFFFSWNLCIRINSWNWISRFEGGIGIYYIIVFPLKLRTLAPHVRVRWNIVLSSHLIIISSQSL